MSQDISYSSRKEGISQIKSLNTLQQRWWILQLFFKAEDIYKALVY